MCRPMPGAGHAATPPRGDCDGVIFRVAATSRSGSRQPFVNFPDLIFVSMENWDDVWRRNQFFCAEFARRHPDRQILFVGLARDVTNAIRHRKLSEMRGGVIQGPNGLSNITVSRPLKLLPNTLPQGRRFNQWLFEQHIRRCAQSLNMKSPLLWLNPHSAVHLCGRLGECAVIYDITDDWTALKQPAAVTEQVRSQDAELCRRADAVIVCSQKLLELKSAAVRSGASLTLIPNGVDAEHYRPVLDHKEPLPAGAAAWSRPVLGYVGTIHPERIDVDLLRNIAEQLQARDGSVVLVGPNHLQPPDMRRLAAPNIHFAGPVSYERVPDYLRAFDVCIVPHRVTAFTESLNPIKLWEYLASGKPIVSTAVAGFRDYPELLRIASTAEDFIKAAVGALDENPVDAEARRAEARRHSWKTRVDDVEMVIERILRRTAPLS